MQWDEEHNLSFGLSGVKLQWAMGTDGMSSEIKALNTWLWVGAWELLIIPVHERKRRRRCPVVPWPAWWDAKRSPVGVWGWGVHRPAGWPGSTDSGTNPCETAPSSAPTERSNKEGNELKVGEMGCVIMQHGHWWNCNKDKKENK